MSLTFVECETCKKRLERALTDYGSVFYTLKSSRIRKTCKECWHIDYEEHVFEFCSLKCLIEFEGKLKEVN